MALSRYSSDTLVTEPSLGEPNNRSRSLVFYLSIASHPRPEHIGVRKALPDGTSIFLGRSSSTMGIGVFHFSSISRSHARITSERGGLTLEDLESHNGTSLNGEPCSRARLSPGDVIGIGPVLLVVHEGPLDYEIPTHPTLIGTSYALASVLADIQKVAPFPKINVLLQGETGTGKELVARAIHEASMRPGKFQSVNCATFMGTILQSQIFGHEKGVFADVKSERPGLIESAHQGTLFLDEVAEAPMDLQIGLLSFLETGEIRRLGADAPRMIDARIVAASNVNFDELIRERRFRGELFSRLAGWVIHLPRLRDRVEDIPLLAAHFVRNFTGKDLPIHARLMAALLLYAWPQNVRELKSAIERAVIEANGRAPIPLSPFLERALAHQRRQPPGVPARADDRSRSGGKPSPTRLSEVLAKHRGNVRRVAAELGVSRNTIYRWSEEYGIDPDKFRPDND